MVDGWRCLVLELWMVFGNHGIDCRAANDCNDIDEGGELLDTGRQRAVGAFFDKVRLKGHCASL